MNIKVWYIIFYNIKGGKQVSYTDLINSIESEPGDGGSDLNANAPPQETGFSEWKVRFLSFSAVFRYMEMPSGKFVSPDGILN